ncbi:MAG: adenylate/guanylate cyclase domain-containing protein [Leptospiraceae bacterium]|nr:adenylate/guanylate cyclase domain-containing protein [Leptospiraceae bacterium]
MSGIFSRVTHIGVHASTPPLDAKYIVLLNSSILVVFAISFSSNLGTIAMGLNTPLAYISLGYQGSILMLILLVALGRLTMARSLFVLLSILFVATNAFLEGKDIAFHLYMLPVILLSYFLFPPKEQNIAIAFVVAGLAIFTGLEFWFLNHDSILPIEAPEAVIRTSKMTIYVGLGVMVAGFGYYIRSTYLRAEESLEAERTRSDALLLNILPAEIAARLKNRETYIADRFDEAAILFADLVNFTVVADRLPPESVVALLNEIFSEFDDAIAALGLEKIKTVGDAYFVAGGLPAEDPDGLRKIAELAITMQSIMRQKYSDQFQIRIGIHFGPVVAGVIGKNKFVYDLWGDSVNLASRMESHGIPGEIQVSPVVREVLGNRFQFESRGSLEIKGKGAMETFLLKGRLD